MPLSGEEAKRDKYMNMRPEYQLLLCCARTESNEDNQDRIRKLVTNRLDWDYLLQMGGYHGLAPLLFYHLHRIDHDHQIPQSVMGQLHDIYYSNLARNILLYDELNQISECFEGREIPLVVVKGLTLAETVYRNVALRPMADVDLLVEKRNLPEVMKAFSKLGFEILPQEKEITLKYMNELHFVKHQENIKHLPSLIVNIHWDLTAPIRFRGATKTNTRQMIERAQPTKIANSNVLVMTPEDQILHVIYHATFQHPFIGLLELCDVAELVKLEENELDWQSLMKRARNGRIATATYCLLTSAETLLGAPIPDWALRSLAPNLLKRGLLNTVFGKTNFLAECPTRPVAPRYLLQTLMLDKTVDTLSLLWKAAFPPPKWLAAYYGHLTSKKPHLSHLLNLLTILVAGTGGILQSVRRKVSPLF